MRCPSEEQNGSMMFHTRRYTQVNNAQGEGVARVKDRRWKAQKRKQLGAHQKWRSNFRLEVIPEKELQILIRAV